MSVLRALVISLAAIVLTEPTPSPIVLDWTVGRCMGCKHRYGLRNLQFVTRTEGWATGLIVSESEGHGWEYSSVLHTVDGGRTWRPVPDVEEYGIGSEPPFWFIDPRHGWIGWMIVELPEDRLMRTSDGGRSWKKLSPQEIGLWVHLRFIDRSIGYAAVSSGEDGPRFGRTSNGGETWQFGRNPVVASLRYPNQMFFLNKDVGWLGGAGILWTSDGGATWQRAVGTDEFGSDVQELFFLDASHGWAIVRQPFNDATSTLIHTEDGGRTWQPVPGFVRSHAWLTAVRFFSLTTGVAFAMNPREMFSTTDGGRTWQAQPLDADVNSCQAQFGEVWCTSGLNLLRLRQQAPGR